MMGFGEPLQYSVFLCELSPKEKVIMISTVSGVIQHLVDSVLVIDLGPLGGRGNGCIEFFGQSKELTERGPVVI
jgi:CRISPR-associated protein Cas2